MAHARGTAQLATPAAAGACLSESPQV